MKTLSKTKTYEYVSKIFIIIITLFLISQTGIAQNVGIGTTTPQGELHVSRPYNWQGVTFTGSGVDDITVYHDNYTGTSERTYIIKVSNASNDPDLFDWSDDNGASWHTYYQMSTSPVPLDYGISVSWSSANGHTDNDQWSFTIGPSYPDGLIVKLGQVGMGTDSPASCAKLEISGSDKGVLVPRTDTTTVNNANTGALATGLLLYQNSDNTFYYYDGSKWVAITKGQDVVFERNGTTIRQKGHYDTDDFIFGRNALPQNGESVTDSMFFFDKSKSAFRAGKLTTSQNWSPDNMGLASFAFGKNTKASGDYSTAMGKNTTASGINATAMGTTTTASGDYSTTMGDSTTASGYNSTAMGYYTTAPSGYETVLGRYNTGYTPNSTNGWNDDDRLFVIGNGSSSSHSNALTILKNGNTGINVENPASLLSVNGAGASDKTLASYNSNINGTSVYGYASNSTGINYGGYFKTEGNSGRGVYGYASNTTGITFGGYFRTDCSLGRGVYGYASHSTGKNYGIFGKSESSDGYGGYFEGRGYFSDDFMVGTDSLPQNGEIISDTMLFFDKSKSAFRAGRLNNSTNWAPDNIGTASFASGYNTKASGFSSTAMGYSTTASGSYSTTIGAITTASGSSSTAMGESTTASGSSSTAMGESTTASGSSSTAMGESTTASGFSSTAMGYSTTASGNYSTAMGWSTTASGSSSTAMGNGAAAYGKNSTAMGFNTTAPSYSETVLGRYNTDYTPNNTTGWDDNDRLFVIGNGSYSSHSNALTLKKKGFLGLNNDDPGAELQITDTDKDGGDNDVVLRLQSDGANHDAIIEFYENTIEAMSLHYDGGDNALYITDLAANPDEKRLKIVRSSGSIIPQEHKIADLGSASLAFDDIYYDDLHNEGASAFLDRSPVKEILSYPPRGKSPGDFDYKTERGEVELDPKSMPPGLADENSLLTDEIVSYNYKANYEQQLIIENQQQTIRQQDERIKDLQKQLQSLKNQNAEILKRLEALESK